MAAETRQRGGVTVVVTVLNDARLARTLTSLRSQVRAPTTVLIDDGGGRAGLGRPIADMFAHDDPRFVWLDAPGTIAQSRNLALAEVRTEYVAFLDADEVAPPNWLAHLLLPFDSPDVGYTGGPTPALPDTSRGVGVRYYDAYLRRFYDRVARGRPTSLPMGNSAWRMAVFDRVGPLDTTLFPRASSEDQEIAVRATRAGWRGVYVPSAWVHHDFSDLTTVGVLRKQSRYATGGYVVWRRSGSTYEASTGGVLPYLLLPAAAVVGAILAFWPPARFIGFVLVSFGLGGLGLLALGLTIQGMGWEATYPGMRYRAFEILRRWATVVGAFRGLLRYGISGRRNLPKGVSPSDKSRKP
jgi:cellulose synthase/poly-beta-1,6-N-acetylglucosamine synthase-like glycosyltransferase